jgi:hypothetical protein
MAGGRRDFDCQRIGYDDCGCNDCNQIIELKTLREEPEALKAELLERRKHGQAVIELSVEICTQTCIPCLQDL